jgi:hypothetical protein
VFESVKLPPSFFRAIFAVLSSSLNMRVSDAVEMDEAFTRFASRAEALTVIPRHSRAENGRPLIAASSCSQSSAESFACSDPNCSLTALMNAANSRCAIFIPSAQVVV